MLTDPGSSHLSQVYASCFVSVVLFPPPPNLPLQGEKEGRSLPSKGRDWLLSPGGRGWGRGGELTSAVSHNTVGAASSHDG